MEPSAARALTEAERALLDFLLAVEFPGVDAFREQVPHTREPGGEPCPCGCPTYGLIVDRSQTAPAPLAFDVPVLVSSYYEMPDGAPGGELLLFQAGGWLKTVEVTWYGEEPPSTLPSLDSCSAPEPDPRLSY